MTITKKPDNGNGCFEGVSEMKDKKGKLIQEIPANTSISEAWKIAAMKKNEWKAKWKHKINNETFARCWFCKQPWDIADSRKKELAPLKKYKRFTMHLPKANLEIDVCPICVAIIKEFGQRK